MMLVSAYAKALGLRLPFTSSYNLTAYPQIIHIVIKINLQFINKLPNSGAVVKKAQQMSIIQRQSGMTLVEILIGLLVGAIVTAGTLTAFQNALKSNTDHLNSIKLNQDVRAIMDIMVRDIRRASYVTSFPEANDIDGDGYNDALINNPFAEVRIDDQFDNNSVQTGSCVTYMYNRNPDAEPVTPVLDTNEILGFKLGGANGTDVMMRFGTGSAAAEFAPGMVPPGVAPPGPPASLACSQGTWNAINEPEVEFTQLQFALIQTAKNVTSMMTDTNGDGIMDGDNNGNGICDAGEACEICIFDGPPDPACSLTRSVAITMTARLKDDPSVSFFMNELVKVRNDKFVPEVP